VPCAATGVEYVYLDPSTALTRDAEEEPRMVPLTTALVDHLLLLDAPVLDDLEHPKGTKGD
jgi:hypothetical protein